ncbi:MAG: carbohydrate binding family 9 domain-containing protein, partial [bacterium]|nr:carbohydrate binding family 9 domain-containing protein [bacterium]
MKRHVKRKLILFIFILTFAFTWAQENNTKVEGKKTTHSYRIPETNASLKVDGELDDKVWENALEIELKYEVEPGENVAASVRTVCLLTYAKSHLYVAFKAYDPKPEMLRAYLNDRDSGQSDDWVGLVLDTFNDKRRAFDFRSNPLGIQSDGVQVDSNTDFSWDAIWNSAGKIYKWGYAVEMSIPFSALRFQRSEEKQEWGFDAVRYYPRTHKYYMGTFPRDRSNNCYLCQTIKIVGFKGVRPGRNIELTPTLTAVRTDERTDFPNGEFEKANSDIAAGITASWGISHNMTVNATVNPDFNQVEADALQLDINQPFALYYSEKRSFFTEGADFFKPRMTDFLSTTLNVIYTRSIRDPSWGVKLTGKGGNNTYGAFVVRDEITNLIFPGSRGSTSTSLAQANTSSVFRYRRDIGTKYTLGILATDREGEDYFNRLVGIDGDMRFTNK